jgi:hypothetical protein
MRFPDKLELSEGTRDSILISMIKSDSRGLQVLRFGDDEINHILDYLYPALANEIQQLKTLMQG